jgi:hypothetical protein
MNDTHSRRPPRTQAPATARPKHGAEAVLSSIPTPPGPPNDRQTANEEPLEPGEADPGWGRITHVASARKRWILAGGAMAAGIPASQGVAWAIAGRPDAVPLLAVAALFAFATTIPYAIAAMYEARQETQRKAIEYHSENTIADAKAESIRATHTRAENVSGADAIEEAKRVRASARQFLAHMPPAVTAPLKQPPGSPGQPAEGRPEG